MHILDPMLGEPVISAREMETGPDLTDFFRLHIESITESDDVKECSFNEDSSFLQYVSDLNEENFPVKSGGIAGAFYDVIAENPDIPAADLALILFEYHGKEHLSIIKMDYRSSYTHYTDTSNGENVNEIIKQRATWPVKGQKLSEACVMSLDGEMIKVLEKPYDIDGVKVNYFSGIILECASKLSEKDKLKIVEKTVQQINTEDDIEDEILNVKKELTSKSNLYEALNEPGGAEVNRISEKVFRDSPEKQDEFLRRVEQYNVEPDAVISPRKKSTVRKYERQVIKTDNGIVVSIPMDKFRNSDIVEFQEQQDGSINIIIKNISKLITK